jgi:hypothetical protein
MQPAWLIDPNRPENVRKQVRKSALGWLFLGTVLLLCDGAALAYFANNSLEAIVLALLCFPTSLFVIACALQVRKEHECSAN